jgi:hypothetical protein
MKNGGEINLGSVSVRTLTVGVKGGSDITNDVPYRSDVWSSVNRPARTTGQLVNDRFAFHLTTQPKRPSQVESTIVGHFQRLPSLRFHKKSSRIDGFSSFMFTSDRRIRFYVVGQKMLSLLSEP